MDWIIHDNIWIIYDNMVIQYGLHNINHPIFPSFPEVSRLRSHWDPDPVTDLLYIWDALLTKRKTTGATAHMYQKYPKIINDTNKNLVRSSNVIKCAYQFARCSFAGIYV
jgi:hypothetical protein